MMKEYSVENVIVYHVVTDLHRNANIGDVISTPIEHRHLHDDNAFEGQRPNFIKEERRTSMFVCAKNDIDRWAKECLVCGPNDKYLNITVLELNVTGLLYWFDKELFKKYSIERCINPKADLQALKAERIRLYWESVKTTDEVFDELIKGNDKCLYEGLFYGTATIVDKFETSIQYRGQ